MKHKLITIILPTNLVEKANNLAILSPNGKNLFKRKTKCGNYYIINGPLDSPGLVSFFPINSYSIDEEDNYIATEIQSGNAEGLYHALQEYLSEEESMPATLEEIEEIFEQSDVSTQNPFLAMKRLGLELAIENEEV